MTYLWMTVGAGLVGFPLFLLALHFIKKSTSLKVENENLQKTNTVQKKQIDIAARPSVSGRTVLDELSKDDL